MLFLDCDDETLVGRYTETRRRHPLGTDRPLTDVIRLERRLLMQLRNRADLLIDTTEKETAELNSPLIKSAPSDSLVP